MLELFLIEIFALKKIIELLWEPSRHWSDFINLVCLTILLWSFNKFHSFKFCWLNNRQRGLHCNANTWCALQSHVKH